MSQPPANPNRSMEVLVLITGVLQLAVAAAELAEAVVPMLW